MNPLSELCDDIIPEESVQEVANTTDITIDIPNIDSPPDILEHERKREDIILQKNMNVVSKAMFREETVNKIRAALEETAENVAVADDESTTKVVEEETEKFKEIVETVKNALLSFRVSEEKCDSGIEVGDSSSGESNRGNLCDVDLSPASPSDVSSLGNIPSLKSNSDTTIVSSSPSCELNTVRTDCGDDVREMTMLNRDSSAEEILSLSTPDVVVGCEEDPLREYNSYNYWYIRPEMPVDLSIVSSDFSTENNQNFLNSEETVGNHEKL